MIFRTLLLAFTLTELTNAASITSCLNGLGAGVTVYAPGSSQYKSSANAFNRRFSYAPAAIAYPTTPQAVAQIVKCATSSGIHVAARSGGHSYAAYGLGGRDGTLVIDMSKMKGLTLNSNGIVDSQTGNKLGDLAQGIWDKGQRALPHGTCPYVGTGGHPSYGGYGPLSRKAGLLLDRIVSAQVVTAAGNIVTASATENSDLFWAIRGAAPSFGIVTQWSFQTLPAPPTLINFNIYFPASITKTRSNLVSILTNFQSLGTAMRPEMWMTAILGTDGNGKVSFQFQGVYHGSKAEWNTTVTPLLKKLPKGYSVSAKTFNYINSVINIDGPLGTNGQDSADTFFAKSMFATKTITNAQWTSFVNYLATSGTSTNLNWFAMIDLWGGAIATPSSASTAFVHRDAQMSFQLYASSPTLKPPFPASGLAFLNNMLASIDPNVQAAYANYVDPTLTQAQWETQYFGANYARLQTVKKKYDPGNVFSFPQSVTLP